MTEQDLAKSIVKKIFSKHRVFLVSTGVLMAVILTFLINLNLRLRAIRQSVEALSIEVGALAKDVEELDEHIQGSDRFQ